MPIDIFSPYYFPDSPYRGEINKAVLKLQEDGILNTLKTKWWKDMNEKNPCLVSIYTFHSSFLSLCYYFYRILVTILRDLMN